MKNQTSIKRTVIGLFALLILISGKLSAQSEILGHTYGGSFNGHSYYVSDCWTTWQQAQDAATQMGGYLVAITSEAENEFISEFAPVMLPTDPNFFEIYGGAWAGLVATDNNGTCGFWQWVNGETVAFTNWPLGSDEPVYTDCGIPIVIGICSNGWCAQVFQFGWLTEGYNSKVRKYIVEFNSDPGCSNPNKTYVCHNGMTLCINESSLQDHLDHGDYAGPCGPCNSNFVQITNSNTPITAGHHIAEKEAAFNPNRDDNNEDILVYPNPGRDEITIALPVSFVSGSLRIVSISGQVITTSDVAAGRSASMDISPLRPGMYVIDLRSTAGYWQTKFIKAE